MTKLVTRTISLSAGKRLKWTTKSPSFTDANSTRALSTPSSLDRNRNRTTFALRSTPEDSTHSLNWVAKRRLHHIYPSPEPLVFPEGHNTLLHIVLAANNLVLPPVTKFDHGYGDPDEVYKSSITGLGLDYYSKGRPLKVASRNSQGLGLTAEERVVPFLVSHHPLPANEPNGAEDDDRSPPPALRVTTGPPPRPVGWLIPEVAAAISRDHLRHFQRDSASPWDVRYFEPEELEIEGMPIFEADSQESGRRQMVKSVAFADWVNEGGQHSRTFHIERLLLDWRRKKVFADILKGWSEEPYPVFNHPAQGAEPLAFAIDRAALPMFGLAHYGALLTAYVHDPVTNETKLWIPQRAKHKKNSPGRLDVTAGGGMGLGDTPLSAILREASEEALLDIEYLSTFIRPVGTAPFLHRSPILPTLPTAVPMSPDAPPFYEPGPHTYSLSEHPHLPTSPLQQQYILPGHYYLYELPLPMDHSVRPQTNILDGDVAAFNLLSMSEALEALVKGRFKKSSSLAVVDFMIRGGWVTEENDAFYADVVRTLRGGLGGGAAVPVPWRHW